MEPITLTIRPTSYLAAMLLKSLSAQDLDMIEARSTDDGDAVMLELQPRRLAMGDLFFAADDVVSKVAGAMEVDLATVRHVHCGIRASSPPPTDDGDERILADVLPSMPAPVAEHHALTTDVDQFAEQLVRDGGRHYADVVTSLLLPMIKGRGLKANPVHGSLHAQMSTIAAAFQNQPRSRLTLLASHVNAIPGRIWLPSLDELYRYYGQAIARGNLAGDLAA